MLFRVITFSFLPSFSFIITVLSLWGQLLIVIKFWTDNYLKQVNNCQKFKVFPIVVVFGYCGNVPIVHGIPCGEPIVQPNRKKKLAPPDTIKIIVNRHLLSL